ncbi:YcxB family protein [Dinghuibacter silviterrae]|uniref:YcxB-like protein n=1 Tax=Dinghuibacter silviterrae TaxID=1539049 RepID=A0A4R8DNV4_9BACT|nr:YcxB family protein [Dinghuibacter silviterrae]TDW99387.1 YcxB-like protein [Dinghuibacter silviterrae]
MQVEFSYNKGQVIQALRYHFLTKREIRLLVILVNVFAIFAAILFYLHRILPLAFLLSSVLWMCLMGALWFFLPYSIYRKERTFKDHFTAALEPQHFFLSTSKGTGRSWSWREFSNYLETPHFFHLYFDSRSFFLLPKSAFGEGLADARAILRENIKKA